jgi:uracil-DNA glycosylase
MPAVSISQRALESLQKRVVACARCPRLIAYCRKVAREKRRMFRDEDYWGRPVPSFGDPQTELLILGLAPAAHGANRTGRMFTGDRSGEFLYRALHEAGFANQASSRHRGDGLRLRNCYITAALRCAPPANKPRPDELRHCRPYLEKELELLRRVRAVLALGRVAFETYLRAVGGREGFPARSSFRFAHGASYALPQGLPRLFASYHPSQQNTQTGKLTPAMMRKVLRDIREFLDS